LIIQCARWTTDEIQVPVANITKMLWCPVSILFCAAFDHRFQFQFSIFKQFPNLMLKKGPLSPGPCWGSQEGAAAAPTGGGDYVWADETCEQESGEEAGKNGLERCHMCAYHLADQSNVTCDCLAVHYYVQISVSLALCSCNNCEEFSKSLLLLPLGSSCAASSGICDVSFYLFVSCCMRFLFCWPFGGMCSMHGNHVVHCSSNVATTPPRGWNSYDAFSWIISEEVFLENARVVAEKLVPFDYEVCVNLQTENMLICKTSNWVGKWAQVWRS
jgi:hypothetical protein